MRAQLRSRLSLALCSWCRWSQVNSAAEIIYEMVHPDANVIFGAVIDPALPQGEVSITLIATGIGGPGSAAHSQQYGGAQHAAFAVPTAHGMAVGHQVSQHRPVVVERPMQSQPRVRNDVPTGGVEIPAFLRKKGPFRR